MKKISIFFLSVLAVCACTNIEEQVFPTEGGKVILSVGQDASETKTSIDATYHVLWNAGDRVKVNGVEEELKGGEGTSSGTFEVAQAADYRIVYPSTTFESGWTSGTSAAVNMPATQPYRTLEDASNIGSGILPMMGYSSSVNVGMKHFCGLIEIHLKDAGVDKVNEITVTCDESHHISGAGNVVISSTSINPVLTMTMPAEAIENDPGRVITITTPDGGVDASTDGKFFVVVPAGTYQSLTIEFATAGGTTITKTLSNITIFSGQIRRAIFTEIPPYEKYLGEWRISSWSSSSVTYKNITITDNRENEANTYLITTEDMPVNCGEGVGAINYPFVFKASYIPTDGTIKILGQKVADIPQMYYKETTHTNVEMWAYVSFNGTAGKTTTAGIVGSWTGTDANPMIVFAGNNITGTDSKIYKVRGFKFYPRTTAVISGYSLQYSLQNTTTDSITIEKRANIRSIEDYVGPWKLWSMSSSAPFKYNDVTITKTSETVLKMSISNFPYAGGTSTTSYYTLNIDLNYDSATGKVTIYPQAAATGVNVVANNGTYSGKTYTDANLRACPYGYYIDGEGATKYASSANPASTSYRLTGSLSGSGTSSQIMFEGNTFTVTGGFSFHVQKILFYPYFKDAYATGDKLRTANGGSIQPANDLPIHLRK